ncbi:MAG: hypothetical protein AAFN93_03090 [Bacteroidota bacterium]
MKYYLLFVCFSLFVCNVGNGQSRQQGRFAKKKGYGFAKISKTKARIVCPIFHESKYPYQGIGFKLGDPFALTYKYYASKRFAVVVDAGSMASALYNTYNRDNFSIYIRPDTLGDRQAISYLSHRVRADWVLEGKMLFHNDATKLLEGLQWYIGAGWQWRRTDIEYEYILDISFDENELGRFDIDRFASGPVGVFGIEYAYFQLPVSAFMEIEVFTDILEDPGWSRFQGGIGLRFVF